MGLSLKCWKIFSLRHGFQLIVGHQSNSLWKNVFLFIAHVGSKNIRQTPKTLNPFDLGWACHQVLFQSMNVVFHAPYARRANGGKFPPGRCFLAPLQGNPRAPEKAPTIPAADEPGAFR
jgi:hypothetical protein